MVLKKTDVVSNGDAKELSPTVSALLANTEGHRAMKNPPSMKIAKLVVDDPDPAGRKPEAKQIAANPPTGPPVSDFLSVKAAAAYLMVSKSFLDKLRVNGGGPEFIRLSARKILYRRSDLDTWARQRRFESTAQYPGSK